MAIVRRPSWDADTLAAVAIAVVVVAVAAFKTTFGISFFDDSFYVAVPLRLAAGAHLFTDEAALQSTGSLLAVPFTALWHALFGISGIVLASRLFYVALAATAGFVMVKVLRPSFGALVPVLAASVVLLAPAYNTFAVSYNTVAQLAFMLCVSLVFAARRDASRAAAAGAGALAAFGCVSYPPLALAALPAAAVAVFVLRDRRLWAWLLGGAGVVLGVTGAWLLATIPVRDIVEAFRFASGAGYSGEGGAITIDDRLALWSRELTRLARSRAWWPAGVLSVLVALPFVKGRAKALLAALLPLAVAFPGALTLTRGGVPWSFGVPAMSYLLALTVALVPLVLFTTVQALRTEPAEDDDGPKPRDRVRIVALAAGFSAVAIPLVALTSSSGFVGGMPGVGAAPFALAALLCWLSLISREAGRRAAFSAGVVLLSVQVALLFSVSYKDAAPFELDRRVARGAAAGILTTADRAQTIAGVERGIGSLARPGSRLLVVTAPLVYVLTDVEPLTYLTWVVPGPSDRAILEYFDRAGETPDIVVVARGLLSEADDSVPLDPSDPLLAWITSNYIPAERAGYVIMRRRFQ